MDHRRFHPLAVFIGNDFLTNLPDLRIHGRFEITGWVSIFSDFGGCWYYGMGIFMKAELDETDNVNGGFAKGYSNLNWYKKGKQSHQRRWRRLNSKQAGLGTVLPHPSIPFLSNTTHTSSSYKDIRRSLVHIIKSRKILPKKLRAWDDVEVSWTFRNRRGRRRRNDSWAHEECWRYIILTRIWLGNAADYGWATARLCRSSRLARQMQCPHGFFLILKPWSPWSRSGIQVPTTNTSDAFRPYVTFKPSPMDPCISGDAISCTSTRSQIGSSRIRYREWRTRAALGQAYNVTSTITGM